MKRIFAILMCLLLGPLVVAAESCQDVVMPNVACDVITPVINCNTYDLYNSTRQLAVDDGSMTQIGTTGAYNFTFNQSDIGSHLIILCDNSTTTINVGNTTDVEVWNYDDRTVEINSTDVAIQVWNDSIVDEGLRTVNSTAGNVTAIATVNETAIAEEVWEFNITGYDSTVYTGFAGWFLNVMKTAIDWIEANL